MDDFTKIKLINELIDVVERFYTLKERGELKDAAHLKGFCEGMAYVLIALEYLSQEEATKILKGMGKRLEVESNRACEIEENSELIRSENSKEDLDIPTFIRKQK
jgi:hypothetical protein